MKSKSFLFIAFNRFAGANQVAVAKGIINTRHRWPVFVFFEPGQWEYCCMAAVRMVPVIGSYHIRSVWCIFQRIIILVHFARSHCLNFIVNTGSFKITYEGVGYLSQTIDTTIQEDNPSLIITINIILEKDPDFVKKPEQPIVYEKMDLANIPTVAKIDSSILVMNMNVTAVDDKNVSDSDVLYYTVQVMALKNPVDVSYFKHITDMKVLYNDLDKFYRYMTGKFVTKEEAATKRAELIRKGYPEEIFIKKVSK